MQLGIMPNTIRWTQFSEWELQVLRDSMSAYQQCYSPIKDRLLREVKTELDKRNQGLFVGGSYSNH